MDLKASKQNKFDSESEFEIKNPAWAFWVCLFAMTGCLITFFVFLYLKRQSVITNSAFYVGYVFLGVALLAAVGFYACVFEKLTYADGVYKYYRAFGKNRIASAEEIASVKILTLYRSTRYGTVHKNLRIFFYDSEKNVIMNIIDDGTLSKNQTFLKSLKHNRIRVIREDKYDY